MPPRWSPGERIVIRYGPPGRFTGARPLRVVEDRGDYVAAWLPPGTTVMEPVGPTGEPIRAVPLVRRFTAQRAGAARRWRGEGILKLLPRDEPWSVWLFWQPGGKFWGWYVNLEQRHRWWPGGVDTRDHILDVMVHADRSWQWKDEHELEEAVRQGVVTPEQAAEVRRDGERVVALVEAWAPPFSDGWERWRPDPDWPLPELPADWATA